MSIRHATRLAVAAAACFWSAAAAAQTIELSQSEERMVCWGTEPFWRLEHHGEQGIWQSYGSDGELDLTLHGSLGVAGGAHELLVLWRGGAMGAEADYVMFGVPAEIEISEADDFVPTHEAHVATPEGGLLSGVCAVPAVEIVW